MAAASLAYKCMEVAYMRVIYSSHISASRDWRVAGSTTNNSYSVQAKSVKSFDNLNNPVTVDKGVRAKSVGSPQIAGNHVLTARNRSSFMQLINYVELEH